MEKRFSVLLCTAVLIGAMSTVSATSINENNYSTNGNESVAIGETWNISGKLTNNNGTIGNEGSIVTNAIESSTSITGAGSLEIGNGTSTLSGTVSQGEINVTGGILNNSADLNATTKLTNNGRIINTSSIVAAAIDNKVSITGNGTLTASGSNSGTIQQSSVTLNGDLTNTKTIEAGTLATGSNKLTNNGSATVKVTSSASGTIEGTGTTEIKGSSSANITQNTVKTSGALTNNGSITTGTLNAASGNLTNEGSLKVSSSTSGTILGEGSMEIAGTNTANITQDTVTVSGNLTNTGTINGNSFNNGHTVNNNTGGNIIAGTIDNTGTIQGGGNITINGGTNTGSIIQNAVTTKNTFANNGTLTANGTFTNSAAITGTGNLNINAGGTSSANIEQKNVSVSGAFSNNAILTATEKLTNVGNITGSGDLVLAGGSNSGSIKQSSVTLNGDFTNNNAMEIATLDTQSATLTNDGTLKVSTSTSGSIDGGGSMEIAGTNNAAINQGKVAVTGDLVNQGSIIAAAIENGTGVTLNNNGTLGDNNSNITNNGILNNNSGATVIANAIDNKSTINNNSSVTTNTIKNSSSILGDNGSLTINNGGSNTGTIEQNDITINGGALNNTGSITSKNNFVNKGTITGNTGNLTIKDGSSSGSITQNNVTISGNFNNGANLEAKGTLTNSGTITNTSEIIAAAINNTADIKGVGNITIRGGENSGTIEQTNVTLSGRLDNSGAITSSGIFTNSAAITGEGTLNIKNGSSTGSIAQGNVNISGNFTNNSTITAVINNTANGVIDGANGTLNFKGSSANAGSITQSIVNVTDGTLNNTGSIVANSFTNNAAITGNTGELTFNNGTNTGSITQNTITNNGTFNNNGADASVNVENLVNSGIINMTNGSSIAVSAQENALGGTINVNGDTNTLGVTGAAIESTINIGNTTAGTILKAEAGTISDAAKVNIANTSTLNIAGADVTLNSNDSWVGSVTLDSGSLVIDGVRSNGQLVASTGNLDLKSGNLNIGSGSSIADAVITNIEENTTLNIQNGGKVALNAGDTWNGKIILGTSGAAEVEDLDNIPDGATTLDVKGLNQTGTLLANNGVLLLGDKDLDIQGESYIAKAVAMELGGNIKVSNGGRVAIDDNDKMTGSAPTVTLSEGGTLDYGKTVDSGLIIKADAGNLNLLAGSNLTFKEGSIADAVAIDIQKDANLRLDGSTLNLDSEDQWNGNIINLGGTINANHLTKSSDTATLTQSSGNLNLYNDSNLVLGTESSISGGNITITKGDEGTNGSVLTVYGDSETDVISGGHMTIDEYSKFVLGSGKFTLDKLSATAIEKEDGTIQAALVDVMNGEITQSTIKEVVLTGGEGTINQANFNIDVYARSNNKKDNDTFVINSIDPDATVYVNEWGLGGDLYGWDAPIDRHIKLHDIFLNEDGEALLNNIVVTKDTTFTPIGWYQLNKNEEYENIIDPDTGLPMIDPATGMIMKNHIGSNYTLDLVKYNPQVFRGQVATVAQWMNQLNINDMLFTHSMVLPSFKEEDGGMMANRYAAESPLFAPYQYSRKDGGLWYKMYGTFENLQMNNGLGRVGNNAYGALIGADFGMKELKNGWKFMPTAYVGYNGAHQTFAHMGQYQNGGQAGFLGTWYKDNIILGALAYGGIYDNSMDVRGFNDSTFNYFAGAATKAAYNIRLHKDWVLQPNLFVSYNYFGQQNWHSKFGQMGMMAGDLNGVNIAPGLNLIWEKDTFSAYGTLQYMYNINGACGGRAGNVGLPQVEMERGYIQYGLGINKRFTDRASGYLQAVLRNVGRTGVGFQAGFNYMIGK